MPDFRIENARLSFAHLLKPNQFNPQDEPRFKSDFLVPKEDPQIKQFKRAMLGAANDRWGEKGRDVLKMLIGDEKTCLRDGDKKTDKDGTQLPEYVGHYYIRGSNAAKPLLLGLDGEPVDPLKGAEDVAYSGCYAHAFLNVWAQDSHGTRRVNSKLLGVMFAAHGEPLGSGQQVADKSAFADLAGKSAPDDAYDDSDLDDL